MTPTDPEILSAVLGTFRDLTADLDGPEIGAHTMLKGLGVRSMNLLFALAQLQDRFGLRDEMFREAVSDGVPFDEHTLGDVARFIGEALRRHAS